MKKVFVVAIALLLGATGVQAQVFYSADFSAAEGYVDGPVVGQPAGAASQWTNANPDVSTDDFVVENEQLVVSDVSTGVRWVTLQIPTLQENFSVAFDWQFVGEATGTIDVGICLSDSVNFELIDGNPVPTYNEQGTMIRTYSAGMIDVRNGDWSGGGTYEALAELNYQDGKNIHIRMEINPVEWIFDAYFQKEGETEETMIADDYGYRRLPTVDTDGINALVIWDNSVDTTLGSSMIIDNFVVYGPTSVSDWALF
jgi:hypothetical protein